MSARFDLRQLRYFVAVAEELNFRRAAERLFISQPPLSRQIRELERALGIELFARDTTMVKLTAAGEDALRRARRLIADAEALDMDRLAAKEQKMVRIAATVAIPVSMHKRLAAGWKKVFGATPLQIEAGESKTLMMRLRRRRRELDFALTGAPADLSPFESEIVHTVPLFAALARNHPAAAGKTVALRDLGDTPFFWLPRNYNPGYYDQCARVFAQAGFKPRYVLVHPGQLHTLERIAHGEGCTLLSASQIENGVKGLVYRKLREGDALGIRIAAVWHRVLQDNAQDNAQDQLGVRFAAAAHRALAARTRSAS